jgi:hypothetical protein
MARDLFICAYQNILLTARKFVPAPFAALPSSHLDGLQNIPVSVLSQIQQSRRTDRKAAGFGSPLSCAVLNSGETSLFDGVLKTRTTTLLPSYGD